MLYSATNIFEVPLGTVLHLNQWGTATLTGNFKLFVKYQGWYPNVAKKNHSVNLNLNNQCDQTPKQFEY